MRTLPGLVKGAEIGGFLYIEAEVMETFFGSEDWYLSLEYSTLSYLFSSNCQVLFSTVCSICFPPCKYVYLSKWSSSTSTPKGQTSSPPSPTKSMAEYVS